MAKYIERRDLIFDECKQDPLELTAGPLKPASFSKECTLESPLPKTYTVAGLEELNRDFRCVKQLVRAFLDTEMEGRQHTRHISNMPTLHKDEVRKQ